MSAIYNRRTPPLESQFPGQSSGISNDVDASKRQRNKLERFLKYVFPPVAVAGVTLLVFVPSYQNDPVSYKSLVY
jgi:hypothetical protein